MMCWDQSQLSRITGWRHPPESIQLAPKTRSLQKYRRQSTDYVSQQVKKSVVCQTPLLCTKQCEVLDNKLMSFGWQIFTTIWPIDCVDLRSLWRTLVSTVGTARPSIRKCTHSPPKQCCRIVKCTRPRQGCRLVSDATGRYVVDAQAPISRTPVAVIPYYSDCQVRAFFIKKCARSGELLQPT